MSLLGAANPLACPGLGSAALVFLRLASHRARDQPARARGPDIGARAFRCSQGLNIHAGSSLTHPKQAAQLGGESSAPSSCQHPTEHVPGDVGRHPIGLVTREHGVTRPRPELGDAPATQAARVRAPTEHATHVNEAPRVPARVPRRSRTTAPVAWTCRVRRRSHPRRDPVARRAHPMRRPPIQPLPNA